MAAANKGMSTTVEPIKRAEDVAAIKRLLKGEPRDLALFILGVNWALRASDLVNLTLGQVRGLKAGDDLVVSEIKTGKPRRLTANAGVVKALGPWLAALAGDADGDWLFPGYRGRALHPTSVNNLVKGWCRSINLGGRYGSHTLRKTWGYHQRVRFGVGLEVIMAALGHSSPATTMRYLCIQPDEVADAYGNEI